MSCDPKERRRLRVEHIRRLRREGNFFPALKPYFLEEKISHGLLQTKIPVEVFNMGGGYSDQEHETSKRDQRKLKNRQSAIESRKRKNETISHLAGKVGESNLSFLKENLFITDMVQ